MSYKRSANVGAAKKRVKNDILINQIFEFTEKQKEIIEIIHHKNTKCLFLNGPAGTGKTHLSLFSALQQIQNGWSHKLIYVRSIIESASTPIGMLPGDILDKTGPYMEILTDKLEEMLSPVEIKSLREDKKIITYPVSFLRGKDFKDSFIVVDEAQGLTFEELKTIISRVGEDSKIVFLFDPDQSDIRNTSKRHDIVKFSQIFNTEKAKDFGIHYREFTEDDILRSEFCKFVMTELKNYKY